MPPTPDDNPSGLGAATLFGAAATGAIVVLWTAVSVRSHTAWHLPWATLTTAGVAALAAKLAIHAVHRASLEYLMHRRGLAPAHAARRVLHADLLGCALVIVPLLLRPRLETLANFAVALWELGREAPAAAVIVAIVLIALLFLAPRAALEAQATELARCPERSRFFHPPPVAAPATGRPG